MEGQFPSGYLPSVFEEEHWTASEVAALFPAQSTQLPHDNQSSVDHNCSGEFISNACGCVAFDATETNNSQNILPTFLVIGRA